VRAARGGRGDERGLLRLLDARSRTGRRSDVVTAEQDDVEARALALVREHGIRAMDAWHLATAVLVLPTFAHRVTSSASPPGTTPRRPSLPSSAYDHLKGQRERGDPADQADVDEGVSAVIRSSIEPRNSS